MKMEIDDFTSEIEEATSIACASILPEKFKKRSCRHRKTRLRKAKIATVEVSTFKKELYTLIHNRYKKKHDLKPCVVLLGDLKNLNTNEFPPSTKLQRYLHTLRNTNKSSTCKVKRNVNMTRLEVSKDESIESSSKSRSKHKSSLKAITKCYFKTNKANFEKNMVISDDSESETENAAQSSTRATKRKTSYEKALEIADEDVEDNDENIQEKFKSTKGSISKTSSGKRSSTAQTAPKQPTELVNTIDGQLNQNTNDVTKTSNEKNTSIIQQAFEEALFGADDVEDQHNTSTIASTKGETLNIFGTSFVQEYKCTECQQTFDDCIKLKRHMMVHKLKLGRVEKKTTSSCYLCMRKFSDRNSLWCHMRTHTLKQTMFKSKKRNTDFKASRDLNLHKSTCSGSGEKVAKAVAPASNPSDSPEAAFKYRCNICKRKFADVLQMRKHKKLHNAQHSSSSGERPVVATTSPRTTVLLDKIVTTTASSKLVGNITTCDSTSLSDKSKSTTKCKQALKSDKKDKTEKKSPTQKDKTAVEASTSSSNILIPGSSTVIELKPKFKCCQKIFEERNQLFLHMKLQVETPSGASNCNPVYVCDVCSIEFNERLEWYQHCKTRHKNLYGQKVNTSKAVVKMRKPRYACGTCYMKFDFVSKLKQHRLDKHMSVNSLQKTSSRDIKITLNDLRTEFEQLFCFQTTSHVTQDGDDDNDDDIIIIDDNSSDIILESELHKDDTESQKDADLATIKVEEERVDLSIALPNQNDNENIAVKSIEVPTQNADHSIMYRCDICDDIFEDHSALLEHEAFHKEIEMPKETRKENRGKRNSMDMPDLSAELINESEMNISHGKIGSNAPPQQQQEPQRDTHVNHIDIAVNLLNIGIANRASQSITATGDENIPSVAVSQQNLLTMLITNSSDAVIPGPNVFTQSPTLSQPLLQNQNQKAESNANVNSSNSNMKNKNQLLNTDIAKPTTSNLEKKNSIVISDITGFFESTQSSKETNGNVEVDKQIIISNVRSLANPPPLCFTIPQPQDQKAKEDAIQQPSLKPHQEINTKSVLLTNTNTTASNKVLTQQVDTNKPSHTVASSVTPVVNTNSNVISGVEQRKCNISYGKTCTSNPTKSSVEGTSKQTPVKSKPLVKIVPKSPSNCIIILSDDSSDESCSTPRAENNKKKLSSEIPNTLSSVSPELQTQTCDKSIESNTGISEYNGTKEDIPSASHKDEEECFNSFLVFKNQTADLTSTNIDKSQSVQGVKILTLNEQNGVSPILEKNPSYLNRDESILNPCDPESVQSQSIAPSNPPRIFVRNIMELMEPQCKPLEVNDHQRDSACHNVKAKDVNDGDELDNPASTPESLSSRSSSSSAEQVQQEEKPIRHRLWKFVPTKCEDCKVPLMKLRSFRRHERIIKFKYRCSMCDYHTCSINCMRRHYISEHNVSHVCYLCMSVFDTRQDLLTHKELHRCRLCCIIVNNLHEHLLKCNGVQCKNLKSTKAGNNSSETTGNAKETTPVGQKRSPVVHELPILRDELSILENLPVGSRNDPLDFVEAPIIIAEADI